MKNRNKLIERKAFVDAVGIKGADLKKRFFAPDFCDCLWYPDVGKGRK